MKTTYEIIILASVIVARKRRIQTHKSFAMCQSLTDCPAMRHTRFEVKPYRWSTSRPYVVEGRENGKRSRRFFETKAQAKTYCDLKNIEIENHGRVHVEFDSRLRDMASDCAGMLSDF